MKKILLAIAAVLLIVEVKAQSKTTFEMVSDSLWYVSEPAYGAVTTYEAFPVDNAQLTAEINNQMRQTAMLFEGGLACALVSVGSGVYYYYRGGNAMKTVSVLSGIGFACLSAISIVNLKTDRVVVTPNGVILRLGKPKK